MPDFKATLDAIISGRPERYRLLKDIPSDPDTERLWEKAVDVFGPALAGVWLVREDENLGWEPAVLADHPPAIPLMCEYLDELANMKAEYESQGRKIETHRRWPFRNFQDTSDLRHRYPDYSMFERIRQRTPQIHAAAKEAAEISRKLDRARNRPNSLNRIPIPTTKELLVHHLGPQIAEIAEEIGDWNPLAVLDFVLAHDPAENDRNLVDLIRDEDDEAIQRILNYMRQ